ncbi:DUF4342 domain-containing protein [Ruania zhangjianzhongii]|uniref:DUF4342 domain-containing protein n=1 Tax=Ruania zhangjianzhongii TaxID=2603206 RepID=UPI0011C80294|nr:DUF4342 domain-containing protein [Ruania zhangjianzhongii]
MNDESSNTSGGDQTSTGSSTWYEEFKVSSDNLVAKVRELIREGNVRRVYIKNESGETLLEIPLTAGVAVTVITAAVAPILVAVGAVAALLTQVTVGVERGEDPAPPSPEDGAAGSGPTEIGPPAD